MIQLKNFAEKNKKSLIAVFILIIVWFTYKPIINYIFYGKDEKITANISAPIENIPCFNLSDEQKQKEVEYLIKKLNSCQPQLNKYKQLYGIDINERQNLYCSMLELADDDFEYYCVVNAILADVPSGHTYLAYPDYEAMTELNGLCYNSKNVLANDKLKSSTYYWKELLNKKYVEILSSDFAYYTYVDGQYVLNECSEDFSVYDTIASINNRPASEYLCKSLSCFELSYDYINSAPYREGCVISTFPWGDAVEIDFIDSNGIIHTETYYINCVSDYAYIRYWNSNSNQNASSSFDIKNHTDFDYVKINSFTYNGHELINKLKECRNENIIVDLRENSGGNIDYIRKYVYAALFANDIKFSQNINVNLNWNTMKIYDSAIHFFLNFGSRSLKYNDELNKIEYVHSQQITVEMEGMLENPKNVYVLSGKNTVSAADAFVSIVKDNELGMIIGSNSGGEGLSGTFMIDILPESYLVFCYNCSEAYNNDGTNNSIYGTSPDVYVQLSKENYLIYKQLILLNEDPYTIENRLKWDNVLIETLEIIKETENAK